MRRRFEVPMVMVLLALASAAAAEGLFAVEPRFSRLTIDEGLSQSVVNAMVQDRQGFVWLATQDGLNRYDGAEFRVFRASPSGLPSSYVQALFEDAAGILWVGTRSGLAWLDPATERWGRVALAKPFDLPGEPQVFAFVETAGRIWAATDNGLAHWAFSNGSIVDLRLARSAGPVGEQLPHDRLWSLAVDREGRIWAGTRGDGGLLRIDPRQPERLEVVRQFFDAARPGISKADSIHALQVDGNGRLWLGTFGGLCRQLLARETPSGTGSDHDFPILGRFECQGQDPQQPASLSNDRVWSLAVDPSGELWAGTEMGLNRRRESGEFERHFARPRDPSALANDFINSLMVDRGGVLWVGTDNGVARFDTAAKRFEHRFVGEQVWSILRRSDGSLWVGTGNGLASRSAAGVERRERAHVSAPGALRNDAIWALYEDSHRRFWVGTSGGGLALAEGRGYRTFRPIPGDERSIGGERITAILELGGELFVGMSGGGLDRYDGQRFHHFKNQKSDPQSLASNSVSSLAVDGRGRLWVGTHAGLDVLDPGRGGFEHLTDLPARRVVSLYTARDGQLWIGLAGGGAVRLDPENGRRQVWNTTNGLPDDTVYGVREDARGQLWLATNRGLARLDPASGAVRVFTRADGLQSNEFNFGAAYAEADGTLYFGGVEGLTSFRPEAIVESEDGPPSVLTAVRLGDRLAPTPRPYSYLESLELGPAERVVTFEFASLAFSDPRRHRHQYRLEGFDPDWVEAGARRQATYTNLDPGRYRFQVRAANPDGIWGAPSAALELIQHPPFWRTPGFLFALALLVSVLAFAGHRWRLRLVERRNRELEHLVGLRTRDLQRSMRALERKSQALERANSRVNALDRAKSDFLARTSHDIRTPLNAIIGFAEILEERAAGLDARHRRFLAHIGNAGRHLLELINNILDLSKIEAGRMELEIEPVSVSELVTGVETVMAGAAAKRGVSIVADVAADVPVVHWDLRRARQMLYNLLANAVRHSPESGVVRVQARPRGWDTAAGVTPAVELAVVDQGPGVRPEERDVIFEEFRQGSTAASGGTGLGLPIVRRLARLHGGEILVDSNGSGGSTFRLVLPVSPNGAARTRIVEVAAEDRIAVLLSPDGERLADRLEAAGWLTLVAGDLDEAARLADAVLPAAVVIDERSRTGAAADRLAATLGVRVIAFDGDDAEYLLARLRSVMSEPPAPRTGFEPAA